MEIGGKGNVRKIKTRRKREKEDSVKDNRKRN